MDIGTIISLLAGAGGGNLASRVFGKLDQGLLINSIAGIVGGGIGGQVLSAVVPALAGGGVDVMGIIGQVLSGGIGGGALLAIFGVVKNMLAK
ncbi:MAG: hypothetical protein ACPGVK_03185 [Halocynthiibacter sp.]